VAGFSSFVYSIRRLSYSVVHAEVGSLRVVQVSTHDEWEQFTELDRDYEQPSGKVDGASTVPLLSHASGACYSGSVV
jgi:hypothetical protein